MSQAQTGRSPHFFEREDDGSVRLRLRFPEETANLVEEAAGRTPLIQWLQDAIKRQAQIEVDAARNKRPQVRPQVRPE